MRSTKKVVALAAVLALAGAACGDDDDTETSAGTQADAVTTAAPAGNATTTAAAGGGGGGASGGECSQVQGGGATVEALRAKGNVVVGTKFDQPLFGQQNPGTGDVEGFDVEMAKRIACGIFGPDDLDSRVEFVETPSKVRESSIIDGKVDMVVATYTINDARKQQVDFAGPYYVAGQDILVASDNDTITGVADLNGKKVCSVTGSTSITNVQTQAPQADLSITFDKYGDCVAALLDGRVEAVTTDNVILLGFVADNPDDVKLVGQTFTEEPYGIGLKLGDTEFRTFVNDVLEESFADGSYATAWEETVEPGTGQAAPEPPAVDRY